MASQCSAIKIILWNLLKKKLKIKDGGEDYIFATTLMDGKTKLIICEKVEMI